VRMQDIKVGEHYALGIDRRECIVTRKGVALPHYKFKGVEIVTIWENVYSCVPACEIVCLWSEYLADEAERNAKAHELDAKLETFRIAGKDLAASLLALDFNCHVIPHHNRLIVSFLVATEVHILAHYLEDLQ